jgi:hypothetical protein
MAEEAFALSPISARPNVPGEADYDAIREAFMETARGRWFLAEYAKRNRTADTSLVLEAVTRLEANLAAQRQTPALSLVAALGAIRSAVRQAKATAIEAMPRVETDETLTGARNGTRIIREIAWTLRECGADTRICDLLDTQVKAIEAGQQALNGNGREDVLASYDLLMQRIEQMVDGSAASIAQPERATAAAERAEPVIAETREASVTPLFKSQASEVLAEIVTISQHPAPGVAAHTASIETVTEAVARTVEAAAEPTAMMADTPIAEASMAVEDVASEPEAALDAEAEHDLAVLDMVAAEMGALDLSEPEMVEPQLAEQEPVQAEAVAAPIAAPEIIHSDLMTLAQIAEVALAPEPPQPEPVPQAPAEAASLGAALIANGVIANPNAPASDPLAPIRKMTQAEKIAFFS